MTLDFDREECRTLEAALKRQVQWLEGELVHTDKHELQRELAVDLERLRALTARLAKAMTRAA